MNQHQFHVGQLRYYDFPKLRELHQIRLGRLHQQMQQQRQQQRNYSSQTTRSILNSTIASSIGYNNHNAVNISSSQRRTFFSGLSTRITNLQLKALETMANNRPNDAQAQYEFLSKLAQHHPQVAIERIANPVYAKQYQLDSRSIVLYLQTLQQLQSYQYFNLQDTIDKLNMSTGGANASMLNEYLESARKLSKPQQVSGLLQIMHGGTPAALAGAATSSAATSALGSSGHQFFSGLGSGGASTQRGMDPKFPLHVQLHNPNQARATILTLVTRVAIAFLWISGISALLDERGMGRGLGGLTGGGGKHIQQAEKTTNVTFDDVKGVEEAKAELQEIVMYLKNPSKFTRLGGKLPRGLLLTGPPGTGKTLLAKAIAGEAEVPFFFSSGSQFEEVYVGLGAKRIRELFETAKKQSPCIIFIDEIDAVGGTRKLKDQSALKMTLNELLVQLDGFEENNGIIVIGATNFMESLDDALLRPGRFDKHITVPLPDVGGRKEILEMYARKTKLHKDVDLNVLARGTTGFSGADLYNLMNQAALKASVDGLNSITMSVLEYAKDKIIMGAERKTAVISPETAKCTAYHEAGHALVAVLTEGSVPVHKATIMPRGQALGMVTMLPQGDQTSQSLKEMLAMMDVSMGGRVAEELIFGRDNATSGAMSDIANATKIARALVTKYGFSDEIGLVHHGGTTGEEHASDETRNKIDAEVKRLTDGAYSRAKTLLTKYSKEHHLLATTLLEYETLTGDEVRELIRHGKKPKRSAVNTRGGSRGNQDVFNSSGSKDGNNSGGRSSRLPGLGKDDAHNNNR